MLYVLLHFKSTVLYIKKTAVCDVKIGHLLFNSQIYMFKEVRGSGLVYLYRIQQHW